MALDTSRTLKRRGLATARAVLCTLSYIAERPGGASAREVAAFLHKSRSTAYHLLASLEAEGFVARVGRGGHYRVIVGKPGAPAPAPAGPEPGGAELERALEEGMREVFARTRRRTSFGVFADDGVAMGRDIGRQGMPRMGNLEKPLIQQTAHALAIGKLLLARLDGKGFERWVAERGLRAFTPATIADPLELRHQLRDVRTRGVATDNCEFDPGFGSVAAPLVGPDGRPVAAIAVTVTRAQYAAERDELERTLLGVTRELSDARVAPEPS